MNEPIKYKDKVIAENLEDGLLYLTKFGFPKLVQMDSGKWWARIEMFVSAKGAKFQVESSSKSETPLIAVSQLIERVLESVSKIGSNK